ncbi:MAG: BREX-1 system adenine-specific DNA-methyltransferase PglX [Acidobacteria bacterium]|nr:BREX-1 system adenine-specific DNA-methyltransferase PglX [Acidobacteriota bacterium]
MSDLRSFTLEARKLLTQEAGDLLQQVYLLDARTGIRLPIPKGHPMESNGAVQENRRRIEQLLDDEVEAGLSRSEAVLKLIKETAFTHLNRFVAFQLMEARGLLRSPLAKHHAANGFKMWLVENPAAEAEYHLGDNPNDRDDFGEAPRDRAYRTFLLWQCGELAKEIRVLFDPGNLPSLLFPRPAALRVMIDAVNANDRKEDWKAGNEETVGWVYQYFNSEELEAAFAQARLSGKKFAKEDIPSVTQLFTPRPTVRFLVDNTLGRFWLSMHPDSHIGNACPYLTPLPQDPPPVRMKLVKEIRVLDPAMGAMHFGLVAFDVLAEMYREELAQAGKTGWPTQASVQNEAEIPSAIIANNLFGIDIDLRAVQLGALALYLKAKASNKQAVLTESNLACADVAIFRGQHLTKITNEMALPGGFTRELFTKFRDSLEEASMMGSLVRLDQHFQNMQSDRLRLSIDAYVEKKRAEGVDESYFANETGKGLRLLEVLERRYDVVFTNPPYVSARKMNAEMSGFLKTNYKNAKGDLYAAFIQRCLELASDSGVVGMLTMHSFMFISSYEKLRELIADNAVLDAVAHYGPGLFAVGNPGTLQTAAFVLRREQLEMERREARGVYFRLVKEPDAESKRTAFEQALARRRAGQPDSRVYEYRQGDFAAIPGSPWVYWITPSLRILFGSLPAFQQVAPVVFGTKSYDNERFVRFWWEVGSNAITTTLRKWSDLSPGNDVRYVRLMKGGTARWVENEVHTLQLLKSGRVLEAFLLSKNDAIRGKDFVFSAGVSYSLLSMKTFRARLMPVGFLFDVSVPSFPTESPNAVLGILNSKLCFYLLCVLNPTINFPTGVVGRLPFKRDDDSILEALVSAAITAQREKHCEDETAVEFVAPGSWPPDLKRVEARKLYLTEIEDQIDKEVYRRYGIAMEDQKLIEAELSGQVLEIDLAVDRDDVESHKSLDEDLNITDYDLAQGWVSYAVGIALGRFARAGLEHLVDADGLMVLYADHPDDLSKRVIDILTAIHTDVEAARIVRTAMGGNGDLRDALADYLLGRFFKEHVRQYRKRPVYWLLQSPKQHYSVYLFHERATDQTLSLLQGTRYLGGRIFQLKELSDQAKQKEMTTEGKEQAQWRRKSQDAVEEWADLDALRKAIDETSAEVIVTADGDSATAHWEPEFDDGVLLNAAPLYRLTPAWKKADAKLDLRKTWELLKDGEYPWAKTAMRYWPQKTLAACKENKSYRIAHGLE